MIGVPPHPAPSVPQSEAVTLKDAVDSERLEAMLQEMRGLVAQALPEADDPFPPNVGNGIYVGSKHHARDVHTLVRLGVTGVLNCASSGIRELPHDKYAENGIEYKFTNVSQDAHSYPILHNEHGVCSEHLKVAYSFYKRIREQEGNVLFFCVAGQNRSATLAVAVQVLSKKRLVDVLRRCAKARPFILENKGFQRQLVELELQQDAGKDVVGGLELEVEALSGNEMHVELFVPGVCTFDAKVLKECSIDDVRKSLLQCVNKHLHDHPPEGWDGCEVGRAWLVFSRFGSSSPEDLLLEEAAMNAPTQLMRLKATFGLEVGNDGRVRWRDDCRFELVLFSLMNTKSGAHQPFTFRHRERETAPGSLLVASSVELHLRAWDFVTGQAFRSEGPIVFSFSNDHRSMRDFMNISTSREGERQQFNSPGEGGILGMGKNAIVHHVKLDSVTSPGSAALKRSRSSEEVLDTVDAWDAAVKRPFGLAKMLAQADKKNEAGVAKRLRMAGALNQQGRLLHFYGLGIAVSSNNDDHNEFKFEMTLLSQFQEEFSTYTLKRFLEDYIAKAAQVSGEEEGKRVIALQREFSLIKVKRLLVSLMDGFRDLTLMGVQAFDFNHLNNVLISRDYRKARLIDIDGLSRGSIEYPAIYANSDGANRQQLHKPALDVDLFSLLPLVVQQLLLGKGRGRSFVEEHSGKVRRATGKSDDDAKLLIKQTLQENFFPDGSLEGMASPEVVEKVLCNVADWFLAVLLKRPPWETWTNDIYDAMRCIDHLPIA